MIEWQFQQLCSPAQLRNNIAISQGKDAITSLEMKKKSIEI